MPTIGWIDALRTYNAGMPSWCVPRKGTPGYDRVMRIRKGEEKAKTFKELTEELERKTGGKPKAEKKSMSISLDKDTQSVKVPTIAEPVKTDRPATKNLSVSNNKKEMAVVPVNYVAEGGSKKTKKVAEGGSKKTKKAKDSDLPPLMTEEDDLETNMKILREYQKQGVLYDVNRGSRLGEVEHDLYVLKDKVFYKIATVVYFRTYGGPTRLGFLPIKKRVSVAEDEFRKKPIAVGLMNEKI